jgi:hypothetical protein
METSIRQKRKGLLKEQIQELEGWILDSGFSWNQGYQDIHANITILVERGFHCPSGGGKRPPTSHLQQIGLVKWQF